MALTDTFVKNAKPSGKPTGDKYSDGGGLFLLGFFQPSEAAPAAVCSDGGSLTWRSHKAACSRP